MKIKLWWGRCERYPDAVALAGCIGKEVGIPLLPEYFIGMQALVLEAPGINSQIAPGMKGTIYYIEEIKTYLLSHHGIEATITVDERSLLEYAAIRERQVEFLTHFAQDTVSRLKATRSWFKDHRFAEIRQRLESSIRELAFLRVR